MQSRRLPPIPPGPTGRPPTINHINDVNEPFPTRDALQAATKSHSQGNFTISARKLPISKAGAIDHLTEKIGIPMPEMIFGDNIVSILHRPSKWYFEFNTPDALDAVDKTDKHMLKVVLYESELDDNGISMYSAKVRVHQQRMLILCRLFMRLDNVVVRLRDTRIYVDFETDEVMREYTAKEAKFDDVKRKLAMSGRLPDDITVVLRNPNELDPLMDVVQHQTEALCLK
ncbi:TIP41-like protein [Metarhizium anisopliae]